MPADYATWPEADRRDWVRKNASFILVPNLTDDLDTNRVAGFIRPQDSNHPNHGSVVYNDNIAEWSNDLAAIDTLLQQQNGGLSMQDMIRMQENAGK